MSLLELSGWANNARPSAICVVQTIASPVQWIWASHNQPKPGGISNGILGECKWSSQHLDKKGTRMIIQKGRGSVWAGSVASPGRPQAARRQNYQRF
jgi:hypothetical protein